MIELIGGEMPSFTEDRPRAGGALLRHLVDQLPAGGDVLVAGPHDDALIDALAERATVTCLIRSQTEATALDARGVTVLCGTLAKLTDEGRYDVVVALDGVGRLCSVEGPQFDWVESVQALERALRPGGTLVLAVENELGLHRLVDPSSATAAQLDSAWRPLGEFDTKPGTPARLADRLTAAGLTVGWLGAAWPLPDAPTLIAAPDALRDGPIDALAAIAAGMVGTAYAERPVLSDPRRLAAAAVRGGLGAELAAAWLVVAHRAPRPATAFAVPPVLTGDGPVIELVAGPDGGWERRVLRGEPGRDAAVLDGPLPTGHLLEELLLGACLRHDLPVVRRLLTGWAAALPEATADNVVVHHDTYAVLDPSIPARTDVIRRFAATLIAGGYAHPWPAATDLHMLTSILHGAAGLSDEVPAVPADEQPSLPDSRREHEEQLRALRQQLADADARAEWYEKELNRRVKALDKRDKDVAKRDKELEKRERELRKARMQIAAFSGTVSYRVAKLGFGIARKARRRLKKGFK